MMILYMLTSLLIPISLYSLSLHAPAVFKLLTSNPNALIDDLSLLSVLAVGLAGGFTAATIMLGLTNANSSKKSSKKTKTFNSTATYPSLNYPLSEIAAATTEKDKFLASFPYLKSQLLDLMSSEGMPSDAVDWVSNMIQRNVLGGKLQRGTAVLSVQRTLKARELGRPMKEVKLTPLETARASVLGWAIEWLQAFFLVADDVMDDSETRRGEVCWYKRKEVGMIAINDSFLLESFIYSLLDIHYGDDEEMHGRLRDLFLDVTQKTEFGQLLDLTSQPQGGPIDLKRFTEDRYKQIVKYKTAFYTFYLPVAIGMITGGVRSSRAYQQAKKVCCIMGEYFQIQDDYLDCYGKPEDIGKVGTDIQDNKCSWLVVQALKDAGEKERKVLEKNYGSWDESKVKKVKELYTKMGLTDKFKRYEEESYEQIQRELDEVKELPREVFELLLKKIYKRSK